MFYWFLKWIAIGPFLRLIFRPQAYGVENVPEEGAAILAWEGLRGTRDARPRLERSG